MVWFESLGFDENPLDSRPNSELVGLKEQEEAIINHIQKGEICFLNGLTGSGKSSLLKSIQEKLRSHKFMYLDAQDLPKDFNLEEELKKKRNFFDRLMLRKYPSETPVLIIDEFQATDPNLVLEARGKWENAESRRISSIIIAQIDKHLANVTPSFKERIGQRTVTTRVLDSEEMKEILKKRLYNPRTKTNYYFSLKEDAVNLLVHCADGNPRRLLEFADMIFDFHHRKFDKINPITKKEDYAITYWAAKEILALNKVNVASFEERLKASNRRKKAAAGTFEERFSREEQLLIKYLMTGPKTLVEISKYFKLSPGAVIKRMKELKQKNAIVMAGKKDQKKLWRASESVKRLTVKV